MLTPEQISRDKVEGRVLVEFAVGTVGRPSASNVADLPFPVLIEPKAGKEKADLFQVVISGKVVLRLQQLGINDPHAHFRGKTVRLSGDVKRFVHEQGVYYQMVIDNLDQLESIKKP